MAADTNIKPTFNKPISPLSKGYQKGFDKAIASQGVKLNEFNDLNSRLNEIDGMLGEAEQSLKKKIFSLAKMEALVFSDPKLAAIYEEMSENGEEKYGYHYNETIQNMLFNDYVLNSPKYLQKYKQAIPKEKKRRDKSGINQLKKSGEDMQTRNLEPKPAKPITEVDEQPTKVLFLVNEKEPGDPDLFAYFPEEIHNGEFRTAYSHVGQHSSAHPDYAKESRPATPEEYAPLKAELEGQGYTLDVLNGVSEMTGTGGGAGGAAFSGSGQYTAPLGYAKKIDETDSASSGQYSGPAMWGSGDLMKTKGKAKVKTTPMIKGGKIIQETKNYLIDSEGFEKFIESLNEDFEREDSPIGDGIITQSNIKTPVGVWDKTGPGKGIAAKNSVGTDTKRADDFINNNSAEFTSGAVKNWSDGDKEVELDTIESGSPDKANLETMEESKKIQEKAVSKSQQKFMGMVHAVQKGELPANKVGGDVADAAKSIKPKDAEDFASTKHKGLPEKVKPKLKEETQTMIGDSPDTMANKAQPVGTQSSNMDLGARSSGGGAMSESFALLEEINNELNAFSIHQDKLKKMTEDRKPSALILKDRLGNDNQKNFKADLKDSSISKLVDIENSLEYDDQQTKIGDNPYKLGQDIEKKALKTGDMKSGEALKNVGDSANEDGDEIPKRNLSDEEQDEVNLYRLGLGDLVYDNEVGERFENRMKADMGDKLYQQRQDKLAFRDKAPMYNKDTQPIETGAKDSVQFNKEQSGWNEREGLKEGAVTGKYFDKLGKKAIIDFNLNEVMELKDDKKVPYLRELTLEGLGNLYAHIERTNGSQLNINESSVKAMQKFKFFTDGTNVVALKNPAQKLNESKEVKPAINEQMKKMKHLVGYNTATFIKQNKIL